MTIPFIKINDINVRNLNVPHIHTFSYDLPTPVAPGHPRVTEYIGCLLYTSPSPRDGLLSRMPSSA